MDSQDTSVIKDHYLPFFQELTFQSNPNNHYEYARNLRRCTAQTFGASAALLSNKATCYLLEKNLNTYAKNVDDQDTVNNYSKSLQSVLQDCKNEASKWRSNLADPENIVSKHFASRVCLKSESSYCKSYDVDETELQDMLATLKENKNKKNVQPSSLFKATSFTKQGSSSVTLPSDLFFPGPAGYNKSFQSDNLQNMHDTMIQQAGGRGPFRQGNQNLFNSKPSSSTPFFGPIGHTNQARYESMESVNDPLLGRNNFLSNDNSNSKCLSSLNEQSSNGGNFTNAFRTARDELSLQNQKKWENKSAVQSNSLNYGAGKRSLGTRRGVMSKFVPPIKPKRDEDSMPGVNRYGEDKEWDQGDEVDERLKNIDPKMVELIRNEIMESGNPIGWDDIAGLEFAKSTIQEIVVWPLLRPDIFTGLRRPPKGILLFGPPGTGKTLIGKCIASQSRSTFFSISASSLTSKWIGDGEKMVRALFAVARCHQPAVIFIDEIDSLLTQRSDTEHESSRRIKTEFLVQLDGAATGDDDRILIIGATNRPQELDEAARRRLVKRLYIPLPEFEARRQIVERLMSNEKHTLTVQQINEIAKLTDGYSGADMKNLCQEASLGPIRSIAFMHIEQIMPDQVRSVTVEDFKNALTRVKASVSKKDLVQYVEWDRTYGSGGTAIQ